jgi:Cu(I)/Ag(I) efflux system membrane fusion protein
MSRHGYLFLTIVGIATALIVATRWIGDHHDPGATDPAPMLASARASDAGTWMCPMHSHIRQDHPGDCPICGMDLVQQAPAEAPPRAARVLVDGTLQQKLGVRLARVERRHLGREIRSWGVVTADESALYVVGTKIDGWLRKLHVAAVGDVVRAGQPLYELYSPDLVQRQREYIELLRRADQLREAVGMPEGQNAQMLVSLTRERLRSRRLFENADLDKAFIDELEKYRRPVEVVVVRASRSGVVTRIGAREGSYVTPDTPLLSLADRSRCWIEIALYPDQLAFVSAGDAVTATTQDGSRRRIGGRLVLPRAPVERATRTQRARVTFDDVGGQLPSGTYVDVRITTAPREALAVPRSALIRTGAGDRVMLASGEGSFAPVPVQVGVVGDEHAEILSGLDEGEQVAVGGQFLLDAAAALQAVAGRSHDAP